MRVILALLLMAAAPVDPPVLVHAWARPTSDLAKTGAAYVTITSPVADRLVGVTSPAARAVELHVSRDEAGIMTMRPVDALPLPPGVAVSLAPGGYHAMLIDLVRPLHLGDHFPLTLRFAGAGDVTIEVVVERPGAMPAGMGMDHSGR